MTEVSVETCFINLEVLSSCLKYKPKLSENDISLWFIGRIVKSINLGKACTMFIRKVIVNHIRRKGFKNKFGARVKVTYVFVQQRLSGC